MQNMRMTIWLGVWLLIVPFLGIPGVWKERLLALTGLFILALAARAYYIKQVPLQNAPSETGAAS